MTAENDIVLVYFEDKPLVFARVEDISADTKPNWYHVKLLLLQIPLQVVTWILKEEYIGGEEFTMGGKKMRLEKVVSPGPSAEKDDAQEQQGRQKNRKNGKKGKIISLEELKKK